MSQRTKLIAVILCLMAMSFFAGWPFWKWIDQRAASAAIRARTQALAEKNSQLKPAWDIALEDDVLTFAEAKVIIEAAGETVDAK